MIERYTTEEMTEIWSEKAKFKRWLKVELAVLQAKAEMNMVPGEIFERISRQAYFSIERIEAIEQDTQHDLLAFVESVRESLDDNLKRYIHEHLTSYDTEEPALALAIIEACGLLFEGIGKFAEAVKTKAVRYKHLPAAGRTHGQHAEPITFGLRFLWWYDVLLNRWQMLTRAYEEMFYTKISGAVGTYAGGLSPELEKRALEILQLKPALVSGQIILRDRHADVVHALANLAAVLEHIALNIRLLAQTEIGEVEEPFGAKQKGSSRMPHKKNTIRTENTCGLARLVRSYASAALENVSTWGERDISQSSVERVIFPDAFQVVYFLLCRMRRVIDGLVVHEDRIVENLDLTKGVMFSPEVRDLLEREGLSPEDAYRVSQEAAFFVAKHRHLSFMTYEAAVRQHLDIPECLKKEDGDGKISAIFDMKKKLRHIDAIFARFGL